MSEMNLRFSRRKKIVDARKLVEKGNAITQQIRIGM